MNKNTNKFLQTIFSFTRRKCVRAAFGGVLFLVFMFFSNNAETQSLPKKIRGYKVYQTKISVKNQSEKSAVANQSETFVKIGEPEISDVSLTGITLAVSAEIESASESGTVDFLTFQDFRVNGLSVDVEEYRESFRLTKGETAILPKPVLVFLGTKQTLRGALEEVKESKKEWIVTGRVFVFGRFKKSFLKFKRVVPIEVNLKIKNPLN